MKRYIMLFVLLLALLSACGTEKEKDGEVTNKEQADGAMTLTLSESNKELVLENENIRLILNAETGGIVELYNKQSKLYLTHSTEEAMPLRLQTATSNIAEYKGFSYTVQKDDEQEKRLALNWNFENNLRVEAQVFLQAEADEVDFQLALKGNNVEQPILSVEYPIVENITSLSKPETDYFASPFITGILFQNPTENFNGDFMGITKDYGLYPSGWEYPMQFSSYYSEGEGGFYWQTRDGGDTIKSFTMTGSDGSLRLSIYHYLSDIAATDVNFDYDICFANMTEGSWYEAANKYRTWATEQSWATETGILSERTDYDKELYENTALTIFGYRVHEEWEDYEEIYDILKSRINGKFLNVAIYRAENYLEKIQEYGDLLNCFEFSSLQLIENAEDDRDLYSTAMMNKLGEKETYQNFYHECASESIWRELMLTREKAFMTNYDVDGFYYDVDIAAVHPKQCYDITHAHGTRVNVIQDFLDQIEDAKNLPSDKTLSIGAELIFEQMLPYVNYYQARAAGMELGWMEHDRIRTVIENGSAEIIPLFDYVYHEYGILRTDGYLIPDEDLGNSFYAVAAYVALNGGIPEFNYEFYNPSDLPSAEEQYLKYVDFIDTLGRVRSGYGKEYLVYGKMMPVPNIDCGTSKYEYKNKNYEATMYSPIVDLSGTAEWENIIVSAYEYDDKIAIFLCNVSDEQQKVSFELDAEKDYGIKNGEIKGQIGEETFEVGEISGGTAEVSLEMKPQEIIMLTLYGN